MTRLLRFAGLALAVIFTVGAVGRNLGTLRGLGGLRGEISKDFATAVSDSPGALFHVFVHESYLPDIEFETGLRNAVKMVEKGIIRMAMSPFDPCEPEFEGNNEDKDADGIPVKGTFRMDCETGPEKLNATVDISDEDDETKVPDAGLTVKLKSAAGQVFNKLKRKVAFKADTSDFIFTTQKEKSDASGYADLELKIAESETQLTVGAEVKGEFTGDISKRKTGDRARVTGMIKYEGKKLPGFPDAAFVAKITAEATFGICPGRTDAVVRTGEGTLEDSKRNKLQFTVKDCVGSMSYNGAAIKTDGKETVRLPGAAR